MNYESLKLNPPSTKKKKRVGCGSGSGHGSTCGRGHKGQKARSGGGNRPGFEGGQMPLIRRLPKRGFNNPFKKKWQIVNIQHLNQFEDNSIVNVEVLKKKNIIKNTKTPVKILGLGNLSKKLTVEAHAFSQGAREAIEKVGGQVKEI